MSFSRLERGVPEAHGVSSKGLAAAISALEGFSSINSVMIMRHGVVLAEGWWHPYAPQYPHKLFSLSKSFTSTAIGMAIAEGLFTLDDPLSRYFRDKMPAELTPRLEAMTVRHLLTMSSGHACCPLAAIVHSEYRRDWQRGFFAMPLAYDPGSRFAYNSTATYMLAALIYRRAGMNVLDYLMPRLFAPLGIAQPTWDCCPAGINIGGWGLKLCTEDIAKFGQLYLQQGQWQGQQIVPAEWVAMATSKQISNDMNKEPDWKQGYGFQFWRCRHNAYRGDGAYGQNCIVHPASELVVATTSGVGNLQGVLDVVWEKILPACHKEALRDAPAAQRALHEHLNNLHLPTPQRSALPQLPVRNYSFTIAKNDAGVKQIDITTDEHGADVVMHFSQKDRRRVHGAVGRWHWNAQGFAPEPYEPCAATMAWLAENELELRLCYVEAPFVVRFICHFNDDGSAQFEHKANFVFFGKPWPTLTGTAMH
ncbi:serine hydrolase domain-containing protein [Oligosphaera ethanolica]|uniref:CubicO group peptidase (Beta-lactamase class C family) n=1 Tax=Oligosphaera ethanolica TaxID=760260 RepID=A0AAE3VJW1_9BACT|nr:serine hydrolase [Oligosphaera ethanolica]MDQ0291755.1 CubicO group peptidase (beta-lactamase class C family) [Oligosphaera ethanolica]